MLHMTFHSQRKKASEKQGSSSQFSTEQSIIDNQKQSGHKKKKYAHACVITNVTRANMTFVQKETERERYEKNI